MCREYHELSSVGKRSAMQPVLDAFEGLNVEEGHDQNSESAPMPLLVSVQSSSGLTLQKFLPYLKKMSPGQPTEGGMHCPTPFCITPPLLDSHHACVPSPFLSL